MADRNGMLLQALEDQLANRIYVPAWDDVPKKAPPQWQTETLAGYDRVEALKEAGFVSADHQVGAKVPALRRIWNAVNLDAATPRKDFFERIIVLPRSIDAGIVLATKIFTIDVYNAYEFAPRTLQAFVNGAGSGIVITDLPGLPLVFQEQDGRTFSLSVLTDGPAFIDGTLDFVFDTETASIPITGQRSIVFPFEPDAIVERLEFLTDIIEKANGKEQRIGLRDNPRQVLDLTLMLEGFDRQLLESILFDSQARPLGVPIWFEPAVTTAAIAVDATVATVDSTAFADFRVGALAITFDSPGSFEVLEIASLTATTITFASPYTKAFATGVRVMPVRIAHALRGVRGRKFPRNLQRTDIALQIVDNDSILGSTAAFPSFNSKVFLTDPNMMDGEAPEQWTRRIRVLDGETGRFAAFTEEAVSRRAHVKRFFSRTRQRLWEIRQLLHALRGRLTSFYIPSFFDDLQPTQTVLSGSDLVDVRNVGYTRFVQNRQPRNAVRLVLKSGTTVARTVISSSELSATEERLQVSSSWGVTATVAEIDRLEIVEEVRMDSDEVEIRHVDALGQAVVTVPVVGVLD